MTTIDQAEKLLRRLCPRAEVEVERHGGGHAWFNVREAGRFTAVEYRRGRGFGVSIFKPTSVWTGYGERPAHTFRNLAGLAEYLEGKRPGASRSPSSKLPKRAKAGMRFPSVKRAGAKIAVR